MFAWKHTISGAIGQRIVASDPETLRAMTAEHGLDASACVAVAVKPARDGEGLIEAEPSLPLLTPTPANTVVAGGLPLVFDEAVRAALQRNPWIVYNLSGGKDSGAASHTVNEWLDTIGHPRARRIAIHADLGRIEWRSTDETVRATAAHLGVPLMIERRNAGDLITRWETRFANALTRYEGLETYRLIGPWSHASQRFCTSELKAQVMGPALAKRFRGETVIQVVGIRREESANRARAPISAPDNRHAPPSNAAGTRILMWNPILEATTPEVFALHAAHGIPLHEAYRVFGSTRLSCAYCVLASEHDLKASASCTGNEPVYRHLVGIEAGSTFSFQPNRWLADVAPHLLTQDLVDRISAGKTAALRRRALEAGLPKELGYAKVWPARVPDRNEATQIASVRAEMLAQHGLANRYPDAAAVIERFAELIAARA